MEYARVAVSLWGGLAAPKVQTCSSKARTVRSYPALAGAAAVVDVFVYVVVLNLFVEYFPKVISETFTLSLLTAVLLKAVLEVVVVAKNRVKARFRQASTPVGKAAAAVLLWVVLVGSKFVVLEAVDLVFGTRVSLGGFVPVTLLILVLLVSRLGVRRLLHGRAVGGHRSAP